MSADYCERCEGGGKEFDSEPGVPTHCEDCDGTGEPTSVSTLLIRGMKRELRVARAAGDVPLQRLLRRLIHNARTTP